MKSTGLTNQELIEEIKGLRRIVINTCYGGFGLSKAAIDRYNELAGTDQDHNSVYEIERDDPALLQAVRELGDAANGSYAQLKIVEIPADVNWTVEEYDGSEWIAEVHRTWS
jgi:hypothetical protein